MFVMVERDLERISRELLLGQVLLVDELPIPARLLEGREVGALQVLYEGQLEDVLVRDVANDHGHLGEAGGLRAAW